MRWLIILILANLALVYLYLPDAAQQQNKPELCSVRLQDQVSEVNGTLAVEFINVGQGDSTIIKSGDETMLVDCGPKGASESVLKTLAENNISRLQKLLMTHSDADHIGACKGILTKTRVDKIIINGVKGDTKTYTELEKELKYRNIKVAELCAIDSIGESQYQILNTGRGKKKHNDNSIVMLLKHGLTQFLFMADCDGDCEKQLPATDIDVLKVGHHCGAISSSTEFLEKTTPTIAVIHVGKNGYGFPSGECLDRLNKADAEIHRTDKNGNIIVTSNGISIET